MEIVGYKSGGHDGAVCCVRDGTLVYSIEAEKDSNPRHSLMPPHLCEKVLARTFSRPDIVCGDSAVLDGKKLHYLGFRRRDVLEKQLSVGSRTIRWLVTPHEMCHVACSFALSDIPEGHEFYALTWEGYIGQLYHVAADFTITPLSGGRSFVVRHVGYRYTLPYYVTGRGPVVNLSAAGKVMALAGLAAASPRPRAPADDKLLELLLDSKVTHTAGRFGLNGDPEAVHRALGFLRGREVDDPEFTHVCRLLQDGIFSRFHAYAQKHVTRRLPLVIAGGCGLNCEWNTRWRQSGLFSSVFVPPVTNDSGIAIGAAAIGQRLATGRGKIAWNVYAGEDFVDDVGATASAESSLPLDYAYLCAGMLEHDWVIAWVQGRYEIGPRALCHRSLLAAPFKAAVRDKLNRIKKREYFRPIAPVCMEDRVHEWFDWTGPSPHMLYFQRVRPDKLKAVTHYDGTARVQTIRELDDERTYRLLREFLHKTGFGVLCNTSLNFHGMGFINRMSDLIRYVAETEVTLAVVGDRIFTRERLLELRHRAPVARAEPPPLPIRTLDPVDARPTPNAPPLPAARAGGVRVRRSWR